MLRVFLERLGFSVALVLFAVAIAVAVLRFGVAGDVVLRVGLLWDAVSMFSLAAGLFAIAIASRIQRVQSQESELARSETATRANQHDALLKKVEEVTLETHHKFNDYVDTAGRFYEKYEASLRDAQEATDRDGPVSVAPSEAEVPSEPDDLVEAGVETESLEGIKEGVFSSSLLRAFSGLTDSSVVPVKTKDGVFYPAATVPLRVIAAIFNAWDKNPTPPRPWTVSNLVGAYRSYSPRRLAEDGVQDLRGQPWWVTFYRTDGQLVTYQLVLTGRGGRERAPGEPIVRRLIDGPNGPVWESI